MNNVDGYRGRNRVGRVLPRGEQAHTKDHSHATVEVVFDGRSQTEDLAGSRIEQDRLSRTRDVISGHVRVVLVPVNAFHDQYPVARSVVFGGQVNQQSGTGAGMAAKSLGCAVDARVRRQSERPALASSRTCPT